MAKKENISSLRKRLTRRNKRTFPFFTKRVEAKTPFVGERLFLFFSTSLFPFSPFPIRICRFHLGLTWKEKARNRWKSHHFLPIKNECDLTSTENFKWPFTLSAISNVGPDSRSNTLSLKFQFPPVHVDFPRLCKQVHY